MRTPDVSALLIKTMQEQIAKLTLEKAYLQGQVDQLLEEIEHMQKGE